MATVATKGFLEDSFPESDAEGCFHSALMTGDTDAIITHFRCVCQSEDFTSQCKILGLINARFYPNDHLVEAINMRRQKFAESMSAELQKSSAYSGDLGVVFHGTPTANIGSILENGLNQSKRSG